MSPFWTVYYAPVMMAALPPTLMLNTWANWAVLMTKPAGRRQIRIRGWVATIVPGDNVISIRRAVTNRPASSAKITATHSEGSNNVVSFAGKLRSS